MTRDQHTAFVAAVDRHKALLYKVANAWCPRREERADLIQDVILELWRAWPSYDGRAAVQTWLYRIAVNVAISAHRHAHRRIRDALPLDEFGLDVAAADGVLDADGDDLRALHQLIARLDPLDRALILAWLEGWSQEETAQALGLSASNVGTRINRIKQRLRREHAASEGAP